MDHGKHGKLVARANRATQKLCALLEVADSGGAVPKELFAKCLKEQSEATTELYDFEHPWPEDVAEGKQS